jgi:Ca2+-transporting ATPase
LGERSSGAAHAAAVDAVAAALATDSARGLSEAAARARLAEVGPNRPRRARRPPYGRLAIKQLADPLVFLLLAATAVSVALGDLGEGAAIAAVLLVNGVLGFWQEAAAERAILALSQAFAPHAVVVRDGEVAEIDADDVVPGDLVVIAEGGRVAADGRVVDAYGLEVDEAALTGESLPVTKRTAAVAADAPLAERSSMVYAGTAASRGRGRVLVTATGAATEVGQIETLAAAAKAPPTPLARRLAVLASQMVAVGVVVTVLLSAAMLIRNEPLHAAFLVGVAVAVAAVPEGLAATVTAALALGARAMARRGAIVRRLEAIETLGETTVICSDKTGTLTQNRIRVAALSPAAGVSDDQLLAAAVLASSAECDDGVGDAVEQALVVAAVARGLRPAELRGARALVDELPFDSDRKRMTVVYDDDDGTRRAYMKGAPEVVAARAAPDGDLAATTSVWAGEGFRVLAVSARDVVGGSDVEEDHRLLGVVALHDPLRETALPAIAAARAAGIEVRMLTGDHPATARTIGRALGLPDDAISARATPADKLALVEALQARGEVVAVTGDGVNDAPALRRADVGVAMGRSGTEAAREAAAIVLTDDDFATIVAAVEEGRRIRDNIRKFVAFLLSANLGEVVVFAVAIVAGLGAPLAVIQVLLVNLMTDGLPAVALARDPADPLTMATPPRRSKRLFDRSEWRDLALVGSLVGAVTLAAFVAGDDEAAQTMAFATLALSELCLVFALRSPRVAAWHLPANRWLVASVAGSAAIVALAVYLPLAAGPVETVALGASEATVVALLALAPLVVVEAAKALARRREDRPTAPRRGDGDARARAGAAVTATRDGLRARPGDRLVIHGHRLEEPERDAEILAVGRNGGPPFRVRWSDSGREGLLYPGSDARVEHLAAP